MGQLGATNKIGVNKDKKEQVNDTIRYGTVRVEQGKNYSLSGAEKNETKQAERAERAIDKNGKRREEKDKFFENFASATSRSIDGSMEMNEFKIVAASARGNGD